MGVEVSKLNFKESTAEESSLVSHKIKNSSSKDEWTSIEADQSSIQNFVLVWLDHKIDETLTDFQNSLRQLRRIVTSINTYTDVEKCFDYINQIRNQKVFMIVSGSIGQTITERIETTVQIESVYVFCKIQQYHEEWAKKVTKIKGVHTNIGPICESLVKDRQECDRSMMPISYNGLDVLFMYGKLLKDILLDVDDDPATSVKQFVEYCRERGKNDKEQIDKEQIDEFETQYFDHPPIWWYTRETFIYSMLNRSLKRMNVEVIQKMGFFIRDLHKNIVQLHAEKHRDKDKNLFVLYRGQGVTIDAFEKMKQAQGGLMSFNNFLSTSRNMSIPLETFARPKSYPETSVGILFKMIIDPQLCQTSNIAYVSVKDIGAFHDDEEEILFTSHVIFRVQNIEPIKDSETGRLFQVDITLVGDEDHEFKQLTESITDEATRRTSRGWSRFGFILIKLNESRGAELIYRQLLENANDSQHKAEYLHYLGYVYDIRGDYTTALNYYEQALELRKTCLPKNHVDLASSYNNIANVYDNMQQYAKALEYHDESIIIRKKSLRQDHPDLANSYNNMAGVFFSMHEYTKALEYYQKSIDIREKVLAENHPDLAASYNNIGLVYKALGDYEEALLCQEKSLNIRKKSLPSYHSDLAVSNYNIGNLYNSMGKYSKALEYYETSVTIWETSSSENRSKIAICYSMMGSCFQNLGKHADAVDSFKKALAIYIEILPENHQTISQMKMNIQNIKKKTDGCLVS